MVTKPWRVERYVMLFLAVISVILIIVQARYQEMFYPGTFSINLVKILNVAALLALVFIHPSQKKVIGVLLLATSLFGLMTNFVSYTHAPFQDFTMGNFVLMAWGFILEIIRIIVYVLIFFKKADYSPLDIILPSVLILINIPTFVMSLIPPVFIRYYGTIRYFMISNALSVAITFIFYVSLLLYGIGAYHLTKKGDDTLVDTIKKPVSTNIYDALHELENLYGDGILTKDEYESKKKELLMRKG
jgi:hypothetical protein